MWLNFMQTNNAGANGLSESLKPVKESVESLESVLQLQTGNEQDKTHKRTMSIDLENVSRFGDDEKEQSVCDKYSAPSTPQMKHVTRLLDDGDCHEQTNFSTEKESGEHDGECKLVEASCENLNAESSPQPIEHQETLIKEEEDFANGSKGERAVSPNLRNEKFLTNADGHTSPNQVIRSLRCMMKEEARGYGIFLVVEVGGWLFGTLRCF